jgi:hypothetical protein
MRLLESNLHFSNSAPWPDIKALSLYLGIGALWSTAHILALLGTQGLYHSTTMLLPEKKKNMHSQTHFIR